MMMLAGICANSGKQHQDSTYDSDNTVGNNENIVDCLAYVDDSELDAIEEDMEPVNSRSSSPYKKQEMKNNMNRDNQETSMVQKGNKCELTIPSSECSASRLDDSQMFVIEDSIEPENGRSSNEYQKKERKNNMNGNTRGTSMVQKGNKCQLTIPSSECSASRLDEFQTCGTEDSIESENGRSSVACKKQDMKNNMNMSMRQKVRKRPWTGPEKDAVVQFCSDYIEKGVVPGKWACLEAIEKSDGVLAGRNWKHVKFAVKNLLTSMVQKGNKCQLTIPSSECSTSHVDDSQMFVTEYSLEPENGRSSNEYKKKMQKNMIGDTWGTSMVQKGNKCQLTSPSSECSASHADESQMYVTEDSIEPENGRSSVACKKQEMKSNMNTSMRQKVSKRPWTGPEKDAVVQFCSDYIRKGAVPGKQACLEAIEKSDGVLAGRNWKHVKFAVKNLLTTTKRRLNRKLS